VVHAEVLKARRYMEAELPQGDEDRLHEPDCAPAPLDGGAQVCETAIPHPASFVAAEVE
jgi:hypothetical protein